MKLLMRKILKLCKTQSQSNKICPMRRTKSLQVIPLRQKSKLTILIVTIFQKQQIFLLQLPKTINFRSQKSSHLKLMQILYKIANRKRPHLQRLKPKSHKVKPSSNPNLKSNTLLKHNLKHRMKDCNKLDKTNKKVSLCQRKISKIKYKLKSRSSPTAYNQIVFRKTLLSKYQTNHLHFHQTLLIATKKISSTMSLHNQLITKIQRFCNQLLTNNLQSQ